MNAPTRIDPKDAATFPSRRWEAWKYTDVRRHLKEVPSGSPTLADGVKFPASGPWGYGDHQVLIANGEDVPFREERFPEGFEVRTIQAPKPPHLADKMPMGRLASEATTEPVTLITVHPGGPRETRLRWISRANGTAHHARVGVIVKAGADLTLLESLEGEGRAYFSNYLLELFIEPGARCERLTLADDEADALAFVSAEVHLSPGATFRQTGVTTGAKLQRFETHVRHPGQGASVRMDGLYALSGERHADLTSVVTHAGLDGQTSQLVKGVVRDAARGVFQGKIVVERGADGTDARMAHNALILSDRGEVDAKPELIIYADDVQCAHGNTVGTLDESALFYMQQRGLPADEARALLTQAFLFEVVDRIEHEGAREVVREWLTARL